MPNRHIMVIEDDAPTLGFMVDFLEMNGYQVHPWPTSSHAIEEVTQQQPDLVVLDYSLDLPPNGWEILLALRTHPTTAHIPIILYSAESAFLRSRRDEVRSMQCDVIDKPFDVHVLLAKIEALTLLSNERGDPR